MFFFFFCLFFFFTSDSSESVSLFHNYSFTIFDELKGFRHIERLVFEFSELHVGCAHKVNFKPSD